jgi:hypothetical protein
MTAEQDDRRKAAVRAFEEREAEAARAKADQDAAQKNRAAALAQENAKWEAHTQVIHLGVMASSNGFSQQGSKYVYVLPPRPRVGAKFVTYDIQESGAPTNVAASVTFYMREGWVRPNTDAYGCTLPAVPLNNVSEAWATSVADEVMFAVLRGTPG